MNHHELFLILYHVLRITAFLDQARKLFEPGVPSIPNIILHLANSMILHRALKSPLTIKTKVLKVISVKRT